MKLITITRRSFTTNRSVSGSHRTHAHFQVSIRSSKVEEAAPILGLLHGFPACSRDRTNQVVFVQGALAMSWVSHMKNPSASPVFQLSPSTTSLVARTSTPAKVVDLHKRVGRDLIGHRGFFYMTGADELTESYIVRSAYP